MTLEATIEIRETVGPVIGSRGTTKMKGGTFMCVQVSIEISRPLCRGRKVMFDEALESWVSFQHERLPNIFFWCGMLSHDDKDCELWLNNKGKLPIESQQFGSWIRASQFSPIRRQTLEVKGFGGGGGSQTQPALTSMTKVPTQQHRKELVTPCPSIQGGGKAMGEGCSQPTTIKMEGDGQRLVQTFWESPRFVGNSILRDTTVNFEAEIQDIDNAISKDFHNPNPVVMEIICNLQKEGEGTDRTEQSTGMQELTKAPSQVEVMGEWDKGSVSEVSM